MSSVDSDLHQQPRRMRHRSKSETRLLHAIYEDWVFNGRWRALSRPGFQAVAVYRLGNWRLRQRKAVRYPVGLLYAALYLVTRNVYGIELPAQTTIGRRFGIAHQGGIVVIGSAQIGDDTFLRQNVTIGMARGGAPTIGSRVEVGAGAVIAGDVTIGDDALIGPNAVVTTDVPSGARAVAPPARVLGFGAQGTHEHGGVAQEAPAAAFSPAREPHESPRAPAIDVRELIALVSGALALDENIETDTPLISSGLVDSLNLTLLVDVLERRYGVSLSTEVIGSDNFDTPAQMAAILERAT